MYDYYYLLLVVVYYCPLLVFSDGGVGISDAMYVTLPYSRCITFIETKPKRKFVNVPLNITNTPMNIHSHQPKKI